MAKYTFECPKCLTKFERYTGPSVKTIVCKNCFATAKRLLPTAGITKVTEVVDPFLNVRQEDDHKKKLEDRRVEYFWEVEVPRMVESGVYSTETMLSEGWLVYNEKGELVLGKAKKISKK